MLIALYIIASLAIIYLLIAILFYVIACKIMCPKSKWQYIDLMVLAINWFPVSLVFMFFTD